MMNKKIAILFLIMNFISCARMNVNFPPEAKTRAVASKEDCYDIAKYLIRINSPISPKKPSAEINSVMIRKADSIRELGLDEIEILNKSIKTLDFNFKGVGDVVIALRFSEKPVVYIKNADGPNTLKVIELQKFGGFIKNNEGLIEGVRDTAIGKTYAFLGDDSALLPAPIYLQNKLTGATFELSPSAVQSEIKDYDKIIYTENHGAFEIGISKGIFGSDIYNIRKPNDFTPTRKIIVNPSDYKRIGNTLKSARETINLDLNIEKN
jgi:hypothetical protein